MAFQYALVARQTTPLAEYSTVQGNAKTIALRMLENIDPSKQMATFDQDKFVFHSYTDPNGITFLCLTEKSASSQIRVAFLQELQRKWTTRYGTNTQGFKPYSKSSEFQPEIAALFSTYNSERAHKLASIKGNLMEAQETMSQNLNEALNRGAKLEIMESKAENIKNSAQVFHREAVNVRRKMCWQKYRWYFLAAFITLVLIFIVIVSICGITFSKCSK